MKKLLATLLLGISAVASAQNVSPTGSLDPSQVYTTGNLVNNTQTATDTTSTWQNVVFQNGLTCWAPGGPGNCGPLPTIQPNSGSMNFSYGLTDVYQVVNISNALASSGTGLRVNGFNFGFTAKNGNGWDDGRVDTLSAYVNFYDKNNSLATNYYYDLNYKFDWTTFYFSKNFDSPYAVSDLSNVRYGFVGMDNNFWAGTYGPEIYGVNFSLKYSVDPCAKDPLSSASCPGFIEALSKLAIEPVVMQEASISAPATSIVEPAAPTQSTTVASTQPATQQVAVVQTAQPVVSQPTTQSNNNQQQQQSSGPTLSSVLNMIQSNARREQTIAASAVAAANEVAQTSVANAEQTALSVASTSSTNSQQATTQQTNTVQQTTTNQTASNNTLSQGVPLVNATVNSQLATNNNLVSNNSVQQNTTTTQQVYSLPTNQVQAVNSTQATTEIRTVESDNVVFASNFLTNRTNPLTDIVENNVRPMNAVLEQKERPMNKNPANNELAMGVDLERMALQPVGYNAYLQLALRDSAFYAPKEIYRNQRVIDNQRAVRLLNFASELKHQEMVNQQYGER